MADADKTAAKADGDDAAAASDAAAAGTEQPEVVAKPQTRAKAPTAGGKDGQDKDKESASASGAGSKAGARASAISAAKSRSAGKSAAAASAGTGDETTAADAGTKSGDTTAPARSRAAAATARDEAKDRGESGDEPAATAANGRAGLKLHHLRPAPGAHRPKTRVGRGEASKGKTAGRGTKGARARDTVAPWFEGGQMPLHRRVPKLKGFSNLRFKVTYQVINTGRLAELYPQGGDVTPDDLVAKGAVRKGERVKVLGTGDVPAPLRVSAHRFSASAREKITAAGGTVTQL